MTSTLFELELLGDEVERRYRRIRPDVDGLPWGTTDVSGFSPESIGSSRVYWTASALQEYRSAAIASATLRAMVDAGAPLDLSAVFARFPLDELAHAEMCARFATEIGGATRMYHDPDRVFVEPPQDWPPLLRAADMIIRFYCVSESFSAPLIRNAWRRATRPLPRAMLGRIARDEAAHGTFGFVFLDWAADRLSAGDRVILSRSARDALKLVDQLCQSVARQTPITASEAFALGRLDPTTFLPTARQTIRSHVIEPMRARGFDLPDRAA